MEISLIPDAISSIAYSTQSLTFTNSLLNRPHSIRSVFDSDQQLQNPTSPFCIIVASPPAKTISKPRLRKTRRVKRKTRSCADGEGNDYWGFGGDFLDGEGYFGGGGAFGGGGGKGWNFGGFGGANWEEFSGEDDPAFDFVYGVLSWIAMSNCLCFSVKKVVRREKVAVRLASAC